VIRPYFPQPEAAPAPLASQVSRRVRFEEVDALGIVWHGRYASWLEDGRVAICEANGIGYMELYSRGVLAPIKKMQLDYHHPLRFGQRCTIEGRLHYSEAARINYSCTIRDEDDRVCATGCTVQLMLDSGMQLLMTPPDFYLEFLHKWREGLLSQ